MAGTHPPPELQHLSQKEIMLREYLYNPWDAELVADRDIARELVFDFNTSRPRDQDKRKEILKKLFSPESHVPLIEPNFRCDYGYNITWGENCFMNFDSCILDVAAVKIGKNFMAGPAVQIYTATHPVDPVPRRDREFAKAVTIGDDVWVGGQSAICPGVKIGNGVTIGAGSVVTKDVPDFVVVAGNPARVIRTLEKPADCS